MVEEFTGNRYWQSPGNVIDPRDHPATNMPTATEDHQGTKLSSTPTPTPKVDSK